MTQRIYLPLTSRGLAQLVAERRLAGPLSAHAVTPDLCAQWPEGDEEAWEYAALMQAAEDSWAMRGQDDLPRRFVVAADVASVTPLGAEVVTLVQVGTDIEWPAIAAAHVDTEDRPVGGPDDADDELAWFATQEIPHLVQPD